MNVSRRVEGDSCHPRETPPLPFLVHIFTAWRVRAPSRSGTSRPPVCRAIFFRPQTAHARINDSRRTAEGNYTDASLRPMGFRSFFLLPLVLYLLFFLCFFCTFYAFEGGYYRGCELFLEASRAWVLCRSDCFSTRYQILFHSAARKVSLSE